MKKKILTVAAAIVIAFCIVSSIERVSVGNVGVVYSAHGVETQTLS